MPYKFTKCKCGKTVLCKIGEEQDGDLIEHRDCVLKRGVRRGMMKAKTKFLKMYYKLPSIMRDNVYINYSHDEFSEPYSLRVVGTEITNDTTLGKLFLQVLGYEDD